MPARRAVPSVPGMDTLDTTPRPAAPGAPHHLRLGLIAILALLPPMVGLSRHVGLSDALGPGGGPLLLVALVTVVWVAVVGGGRVHRPVATLVLAGLTAALYQIAIRTVLLLLDREEAVVVLVAIIPILITQTAWGLLAGWLALGVQRLTGERR